jgi:hypothetical protein
MIAAIELAVGGILFIGMALGYESGLKSPEMKGEIRKARFQGWREGYNEGTRDQALIDEANLYLYRVEHNIRD